MKVFKTKAVSVIIFASLATMVLVGFQNCSSSLALLGFGKPAKAGDINDILRTSNNELDATALKFKTNSRKLTSIPEENVSAVYGEIKGPEEIKRQIAAKLAQKNLKNKK